MLNKKLYCVCAALLLLCSSIARADDDFNPSSPPDPQTSYRLVVNATPEGKALTSGSGTYNEGEMVYINTSAKDTDYQFVRWLKDGVEYSRSRSFYYTMDTEEVTFTAEYEYVVFNPDNPSDPNLKYDWRLYLVAQPEEACSFNRSSGERSAPEIWVEVIAYPSQGFVFDGWYEGGTRIADAEGFNYEMPAANATLTARYHFQPESPFDPNSSMNPEDVDTGTPGDVNGDGRVNAQDIVSSINAFLTGDTSAKYDVNGDSKINVQDTIAIINIFLNAQ